MLRPDQVEVARATINPKSRENSVLQLLMGKGKTSCILPMVALALADHHNLFRIIVPRPLLLQSAQVMQAKLGGLLNREVMHIPFSRKTPTHKSLMQAYFQLHYHFQKHGGITLALPEHILSFKLSGLQRLCDGRIEEARTMIKTQRWLEKQARDVMDECDVSLAIRTQLIYPSGSQMMVDGHPLRWQTIQAVLRLVSQYLPRLRSKLPRSIVVVELHQGGYPLVYFLRRDAEDDLIAYLVHLVCEGQTSILPGIDIASADREELAAFISLPMVNAKVISKVTGMFKTKTHLMNVVRHLRGLFAHRVLISSLKKRWNVQFGLDANREPIAVPYLAKGIPSPTAEWGHPDVAIILTCLSFYYQGLDVSQFKQAFEQLLKLDEPSIEFEKWTTSDIPTRLQNYNAVHTEDTSQLQELHGFVCHNPWLLNFYMNRFVFPRHARQFSTKLQASGWDLVLYNPKSESNFKTTGFSGTNDSRHQLPMTVNQNDLPKLAHTNAEVLAYLLEDRNRHYVRMIGSEGNRITEEGLLEKLLNPYERRKPDPKERIRVLIDAGAQILEHDNGSLAKAWLKIDTEATAAVYFKPNHQAWVVYKNGQGEALLASPYAESLDGCLVYLDESHCRGTDLKLPSNARAALTLGPHLTKDALVQAAMRLRLLGQTQSVTFFSPPEVHQSIIDMSAGDENYRPESPNVVRWLLEQTCNSIEQLEPLYYNQGMNYLQHIQARLKNLNILHDDNQRVQYLKVMQSSELQTLKQLYEPRKQSTAAGQVPYFDSMLQPYATELIQRRKNFQDRGFAVHSSALEEVEVEQEREVEFEIESVREIQAPDHFKPLKVTRLHKDIEKFVASGYLPAGSDAYQPMFFTLQKTELGVKYSGSITAATKSPGLYVSTQFNRTVSVNTPNDHFLRPCHWIIWSCCSGTGLLVSPEEANYSIPVLRDSCSNTHLIIYNAPVTRRMLHFNNLDYFAIPALPSGFKMPMWLKVELGIFAGRLYFEWDEYDAILEYLGMQIDNGASEELFMERQAFAKKPLAFLHEWLAVRRKGQEFEHTPMGFITTGKPLSLDHPFFLAFSNEALELNSEIIPSVLSANRGNENESDESDDDDDDDHLFTGGDREDEDVEPDFEERDIDENNHPFFNGRGASEDTEGEG